MASGLCEATIRRKLEDGLATANTGCGHDYVPFREQAYPRLDDFASKLFHTRGRDPAGPVLGVGGRDALEK